MIRTILFGLAAAQPLGCNPAKPAPEKTIETIPEAPKVLIARSDSIFKIAEALRLSKNHEEAIRLHEQALTLRKKGSADDERMFYSNWRLAQILINEQRVEAGDARYDEARRFSESLPLPYDTIVSLLLSAAYSKSELRDFTTSRSLAGRALQLVEEKPGADALKSRCYHALANTYHNERKYEEAIRYFRREESIAAATGNNINLSRSYLSIALSYLMQGKSNESLRYLNKSQTIFARLYGVRSDWVATVMLNKSGAFMQLGQMDSVNYCIKMNLEIRTMIYGVKSTFCAGARETIGKFFEAKGQYDSALVYYQGSLNSFVRDFDENDYHLNPHPSPTEISSFLADFLVNKAHLLKAIYEHDSTRTDALNIALKTYQLADSVFQAYQNKLSYDDPKLANLEARPISYEDMASIASTLFRSTGNEQYLQNLFHIMEASRNSVLKGALSRAASFQEKAVPDSLQMMEKQLQEKRTRLVSMAAAYANDQHRSDSISQAVLKLDGGYQRLLTVMRERDPGYSLIRHGLNALSVNELKQLMKDKNGLWIEYLWGKEHVYAIGVDAQGINTFRLEIIPQLLGSIQWLSTNSRSTTDSTFTKAYFRRYYETSHSLYNQLVAPLVKDKELKRIIICPEGPLNSFPFDVLVSEAPSDDEIDYHLEYLINQYSIGYHFSSAYLKKQATDERHGHSLMALGYGTTELPLAGGLANLPGTLEEVSAIGKIMNDADNLYLLDKDASEQSFKSRVEQYNILHLAVHGIADTTNAMNSKLIFRAAGDGQDGELFAHEVYSLNLAKMDLAVLSACESGTGKSQAGEGVMSIARGFAYAQCPSLVMSLWKIDDKTSANVMAKFYGQLNEGNDIDEALALAKRNYLQGEKQFKSHPSYWAAFISMGETKPIAGTRLPWAYMLATFTFFMAVIILFRLKNKKNPAGAGSFVSSTE